MRILVVDDDDALARAVCAHIEAAGHTTRRAGGGREALHAVGEGDTPFDAIVCDINMPDIDGFTVCRQLRAQGDRTPVILLTSRDSDIDEALGLELGADDYMTKPYSPRVLLARLGVIARRGRAPAEVVAVDGVSIDRARLEVRVDGAPIETTLTELRMLAALVEHRGRVLSRDRLLELGREDDSVVAPRIVDAYVARLRKKLGAHAARLETVTGAGYRWRE